MITYGSRRKVVRGKRGMCEWTYVPTKARSYIEEARSLEAALSAEMESPLA